MKVYLVSRSQGDYDENRSTNMTVFTKKSDAERYVFKCKSLFPKLHEFYYNIYFSGIRNEHPLADVSFYRWRNYQTAEFYIEEFELR